MAQYSQSQGDYKKAPESHHLLWKPNYPKHLAVNIYSEITVETGTPVKSVHFTSTVFPHIRCVGIISLFVFYSKVTVHKAKGDST